MSTDEIRRALVESGAMTTTLEAVLDEGGPVWDTDGLRADFDALGFMAPFIIVRRKADGVRGTLMFTHSPRYYFCFEAE